MHETIALTHLKIEYILQCNNTVILKEKYWFVSSVKYVLSLDCCKVDIGSEHIFF